MRILAFWLMVIWIVVLGFFTGAYIAAEILDEPVVIQRDCIQKGVMI